MDERWAERCRAQHVHILEGGIPPRVTSYGFVLARDEKSLFPLGGFERCGEAAVYPPQTLNTVEEQAMLASAMGLARMWDQTGVLTVRFVKQQDGSDFALLDIDETLSPEARHLLTLRGLEEGALPCAAGQAPELLELACIGVSHGDTLVSALTLRGALQQLPQSLQASVTGWFDKVLRHDR